jgi:hypothetical protein
MVLWHHLDLQEQCRRGPGMERNTDVFRLFLCFKNVFEKKLIFLLQINYILVFLYRFDMLMPKIIFKNKKNILMYF